MVMRTMVVPMIMSVHQRGRSYDARLRPRRKPDKNVGSGQGLEGRALLRKQVRGRDCAAEGRHGERDGERAQHVERDRPPGRQDARGGPEVEDGRVGTEGVRVRVRWAFGLSERLGFLLGESLPGAERGILGFHDS